MQNSKTDRRVRYTKKLIRDTFLELLETRPVDEISVKELCEIGDINRGTFYSHYADIYALMEEIEADYAASLSSICADMYREKDYKEKVADEICRFFRSNPTLCSIVFNRHASGRFMTEVFEGCKPEFTESWSRRGEVSSVEADYIFRFMSRGSAAILEMWYRDGFSADMETVKKLLVNLTFYGLNSFLTEKSI